MANPVPSWSSPLAASFFELANLSERLNSLLAAKGPIATKTHEVALKTLEMQANSLKEQINLILQAIPVSVRIEMDNPPSYICPSIIQPVWWKLISIFSMSACQLDPNLLNRGDALGRQLNLEDRVIFIKIDERQLHLGIESITYKWFMLAVRDDIRSWTISAGAEKYAIKITVTLSAGPSETTDVVLDAFMDDFKCL